MSDFSTALLDLLPFGVAVLNRKFKILFANAFAAELLLVDKVFASENGYLRVRSATHNRILCDAVQRLAGPGSSAPMMFSIARTGRHPISIVSFRLRSGRSRLADKLDTAKIGIIFCDPDLTVSANQDVIRELFHFTRVESSIAMNLMNFKDTAAIADELSITDNTVRDHLKSMFPKVCARNQLELLHILLRSPAVLRINGTV